MSTVFVRARSIKFHYTFENLNNTCIFHHFASSDNYYCIDAAGVGLWRHQCEAVLHYNITDCIPVYGMYPCAYFQERIMQYCIRHKQFEEPLHYLWYGRSNAR